MPWPLPLPCSTQTGGGGVPQQAGSAHLPPTLFPLSENGNETPLARWSDQLAFLRSSTSHDACTCAWKLDRHAGLVPLRHGVWLERITQSSLVFCRRVAAAQRTVHLGFLF